MIAPVPEKQSKWMDGSQKYIQSYNHNETRHNKTEREKSWDTLSHWGRVTHICVTKQTTIGSDNGLSPGRRQAIIWTNVGILLIGPLGTKFNDILIEIHTFSFKEMYLKMSSKKWRPFCLGLNVLFEDHMFSHRFRVLHEMSFGALPLLVETPRQWWYVSCGGDLQAVISRICSERNHRMFPKTSISHYPRKSHSFLSCFTGLDKAVTL